MTHFRLFPTPETQRCAPSTRITLRRRLHPGKRIVAYSSVDSCTVRMLEQAYLGLRIIVGACCLRGEPESADVHAPFRLRAFSARSLLWRLVYNRCTAKYRK